MLTAGLFDSELGLILFPSIRDFTRTALSVAPAYFLSAPSSTSGNHHPPDERGDGGMVLHTKRVTRMVYDLASSFGIEKGMQVDWLVSAALLHDIVAQGTEDKSMGKTWSEHDIGAVSFLDTKGLRAIVHPHDWNQITKTMSGHMGRWASSQSLIPYPTSLGHILHLADYIASRECVRVDPL